MNSAVAQVIFEQEPSVKGVYADLSSGRPEYYVKCPECGHVHGNFATVQDAVNNKTCGSCKFERVHKIKGELEKNFQYKKPKAGQKRKLPWPLVTDSLLEDEEDFARDLIHTTEIPWYEKAREELSEEVGAELELDPKLNDDSDFTDPDAADSIDKVYLTGGHDWTVYKTDDLAEEAAIEYVRDQLRTEPELFTQDWLVGFINMDRLRNLINMDRDEEEDGLIEDPMDYLRDIYGDEAIKYALEMVPIDIDAAAKDAVRTDGWQHFLSHYDSNSIELPCGAVAYRS